MPPPPPQQLSAAPSSGASAPSQRVQLAQGCRSLDTSYRKIHKISEGTYGIVFRGQCLYGNREIVALKQLKCVKSQTSGFPLQALREITILQQLQHPNIVKVYEVVSVSGGGPGTIEESLAGTFCLVMEYMPHEICNLLKIHSFTYYEIKNLTEQLLSAVAHLHKNYITHRDIKSSNLLYANRNGVLKLCDFGLARRFGNPIFRNGEDEPIAHPPPPPPAAVPPAQSNGRRSGRNRDDQDDSEDSSSELDVERDELRRQVKEQRQMLEELRRKNNASEQAQSAKNKSTSAGNTSNKSGNNKLFTSASTTSIRYTTPVVTLWYRSPELCLGAKVYDPRAVDMWSVGCVVGELVKGLPIFQAQSESEQLRNIFRVTGKPDLQVDPWWRRFHQLRCSSKKSAASALGGKQAAGASSTSSTNNQERSERWPPAIAFEKLEMVGWRKFLFPPKFNPDVEKKKEEQKKKNVTEAMRERLIRDAKSEKSIFQDFNNRSPDSPRSSLDPDSDEEKKDGSQDEEDEDAWKLKPAEDADESLIPHENNEEEDFHANLCRLIDFFVAICEVQPDKRATAEQCLQHPFLTEGRKLKAFLMPTFPETNDATHGAPVPAAQPARPTIRNANPAATGNRAGAHQTGPTRGGTTASNNPYRTVKELNTVTRMSSGLSEGGQMVKPVPIRPHTTGSHLEPNAKRLRVVDAMGRVEYRPQVRLPLPPHTGQRRQELVAPPVPQRPPAPKPTGPRMTQNPLIQFKSRR
ncbi:unnamed protein product [Amoebophrya sp. A120]|nr:unnamed protein product [Amoebophrya sp. A120]|eukprot:GSA120T00005059001.1